MLSIDMYVSKIRTQAFPVKKNGINFSFTVGSGNEISRRCDSYI